jgi:uncharacterized integral membrane protein
VPKKLLYFIIFLLVALLFFLLNKDHVCDITFFPRVLEFKAVPVVYSSIISFLLGVLIMAPFSLFRPKKRDPKPGKHGGKSTGSE